MYRILVCLLLVSASPAALAAAEPASAGADELVGLWQAKRWFGPFARGPLTLRRSGEIWTATMIGQDFPVRVEGQTLSFDLPHSQGAFRGRLPDRGVLLGHWFPPPSIA